MVAAHHERQDTLCGVLLQKEIAGGDTPADPPPQELESPLSLPELSA